jgi:pimeloyl-ACP methyl ester carboxylesterase
MKRHIAWALVVLATLATGACTSNWTVWNRYSSTAPTPEPVRWTDCGGGFECGSVRVPLDYAHPRAGTIQIALNRRSATEPAHRIGSLLVNPGGPGASGLDFVRQVVAAGGMKNLNRRFDLVGFDPRGVGRSAPIRCLDGPSEDVFDAIDTVLDDPEEKQAAIVQMQQFASGCARLSGRVLPFVDTVSTAKDLDLIRIAIGATKLTYVGFSYGSYLGETYAHLFPTHVRAMALDGVMDPTVDANDMIYGQAVGFEQNLQAFLRDCRARGSNGSNQCQSASAGDPYKKLVELMQQLDAQPLQVSNRQLTRALAVTGIVSSLYEPSGWSALEKALSAPDQGIGLILLRQADSYLGRDRNGTYDNMMDANIAVNCLDRPVPMDISAYDELNGSFEKASLLFGRAFQYSNLVCAYWPVQPSGKVGPLDARGAPPILLVGGTGDPATPYSWAQSVHRQIANSVLLTRTGYGHVSYNKSKCAQDLEDRYLIDLALPAADTVCS